MPEVDLIGLVVKPLADTLDESTMSKNFAHYQITGKLGQGGMGEVYRATDTKLE